MTPTSRRSSGTWLRVLALVTVAVVVGLAAAWTSLRVDSREVVIGAQTSTVRPTFDGYATLDLGPLLPRLRLAQDLPLDLGVDIDVGETVGDATSIDALIQQNAVIASQPAGELATLRSAVRSMVVDALVRGLGAGLLAALLTAGVWWLLGPTRRAELRLSTGRVLRERRRRPLLVGGAVLGVTALATMAVVAPYVGHRPVTDDVWVPAVDLVPQAALTGQLADIEVARGAATSGSLLLIESAIKTYNTSVTFYGDLLEAVPTEGFRVPAEDETVALLVSDRHDNIGMDPVARAIGDAGGATLLIAAGDDTSTGGAWEAFSVKSLADAFDGYEVVAVAGNHDTGPTVVEEYEDAGFTVLDGEPVEVAGIRFLGDNDPRSSGLTAVYVPGSETVTEQSARLADVACEQDEPIATLVVHSPSSGVDTAERGCADLVVSGHLHRQVGPETVIGDNGLPSTVYTNGTTGGAAFAFALGSKLRREAQVTLVTYRDGRPVGLQPVSITPGGTVRPDDYVELPVSGTGDLLQNPGVREQEPGLESRGRGGPGPAAR